MNFSKILTVLLLSPSLALTYCLSANAVTLAGLLSRSLWTDLGKMAAYDVMKEGLLSGIPGANENTSLTEQFFDSIDIDSFVLAGSYSFYTDKNGEIKSIITNFDVDASSEREDLSLNFDADQRFITPEEGLGIIFNTHVEAKVTAGFFGDTASLTRLPIDLETADQELTGETMYAGSFGLSYIDGIGSPDVRFGSSFKQKSIRKVPEPFSIIGSTLALGGGVILRKLKK